MTDFFSSLLDKGNCGVVRPCVKEAGVKPTSLRTETGYEAGDADELVPHNEVRVSASQIKSGVVLGKFTSLPGETCPASGPARKRGTDTIRGKPRRSGAGDDRGGEVRGRKTEADGQSGEERATGTWPSTLMKITRPSICGLGVIASVASVSSCAKSVFRVFCVFRGDQFRPVGDPL
jgi:hypothetical protein